MEAMGRVTTDKRIPGPLFPSANGARNALFCIDESGQADQVGEFVVAGVVFVDEGEFVSPRELEASVAGHWDKWAKARYLRKKKGRKYSDDELREFVDYARLRMMPFAVTSTIGPEELELLRVRCEEFERLEHPGKVVSTITPRSIRWKLQVARAFSHGLALALGAFGRLKSIGVRIDRIAERPEARQHFMEWLQQRSGRLAAGTIPDAEIPVEIPVEAVSRIYELTSEMVTLFDPNLNGPLADVPDVVASIVARQWHGEDVVKDWFGRYTKGNPEFVVGDYSEDFRVAVSKVIG